MSRLQRALALLSGVSAGVLLCAGAIVAPVVFMTLSPDHATAGRLAAKVFEISYWLTGLTALLVVLTRMPQSRGLWLVVWSLLGLSALQLGWITPALLNRGQGWPFAFAALHGTASVIHVLMILLALIGSWKLSAK